VVFGALVEAAIRDIADILAILGLAVIVEYLDTVDRMAQQGVLGIVAFLGSQEFQAIAGIRDFLGIQESPVTLESRVTQGIVDGAQFLQLIFIDVVS
jgi:hypothetical protein